MSNEILTSQSEKILNAALKCIYENGYANVSLRDIAEEAGVVLSQVNYYYKNKEGLFVEVIKTVSHIYLVQIEECLQVDNTSKERMLRLSEYFKNMMKDEPEIFRLLIDFINMSIWSETFGVVLRNLFKDISNLIEKYIIDGKFLAVSKLKSYPSSTLARIIIGVLLGVSIQNLLEPQQMLIFDVLGVISTEN